MLSLRNYHHDVIAHSHDHPQLVFGLTGLLEFEMGGRASCVGERGLAVIPSATHHACASTTGSHCLVLDLPSENWVRENLGHHAERSLRLLDRPNTLRLAPAQQSLVAWLARSPINDSVIAAQGTALLLASLASTDQPLQDRHGLPLAAIDAFIDQHLPHPLQVADLARIAGCSVARLHARFLHETGRTPMEHVRARRLQHAEALLHETRLPVAEIAARVGYASQSAFTAALVRVHGRSPRMLRRELRDKTRD
ncbi:AraC family transcriptional regulator [Pseudomonas songnenensis]|uniref:Helix-turn-helix domain-containing protein n=1 Tax=Pseudomonas songnenensis TaxID=1176259 RepID=A0A482U128_9PSED|nr:AraC family transcriptional regulator [Pseudomonas songnenensis]RYJ60379.1 helix-turn-helix domain-containing protein [Pseudomonas songnenensis]